MEHRIKSGHILNSSANLLGICFLVLTSLKVLNLVASSIIDEFTAAASVLFMLSSLLSFLSIRSTGKSAIRFENWADLIFLGGLVCLFITTMLITFNFVK